MKTTRAPQRQAFSLVELLVVIAILAVVLAIALPTLAAARENARSIRCAANLSQLGVAISMHLADHKDWLPQVRADFAGNIFPPPQASTIGSLFAGKRGTLPIFGIDRLAADARPLNRYLGDFTADSEVEVCQDPSDEGTQDPGLAYLQQQLGLNLDTSSMYDLVGTSYNLNDHALDEIPGEDAYPTLIPRQGGRIPDVQNPSRTWLVGDQPIYNFEDGGDRRQRWHSNRVIASLLYVDMHVEPAVPVAPGAVNTTDRYTFLPRADWLEQFAPPAP